MPKIDKAAAPRGEGTRYPAPFDVPCQKRTWHRLGDAADLTQFGVNLLRLPPGAWSSQRHWHAHEDEFVYVLDGEVVLLTDAGEEILRAGDCAAFKAGMERPRARHRHRAVDPERLGRAPPVTACAGADGRSIRR